MSDCSKFLELISAMVDGELDVVQESELRTHIEHCGECKKVYETFKGISDALADDLVEPPETLTKEIMHKINLEKRNKRNFIFGRFTAAAACLALILLGAWRLDLFGGNGKSVKMSAAPEEAEISNYADMKTEAASGSSKSFGLVQDSAAPESSQPNLRVSREPADSGLQLGFPAQNAALANGVKSEEIEKEPAYLLQASVFSVYEGRYYSDEDENDKNVLMFIVTDEKDLDAFSELLTAVPENVQGNKPEDGTFIENEPKYTVYVPADREKDKYAKDKIISVWFIKNEIWCLSQDVIQKESGSNKDTLSEEKILYKAAGRAEKFEDLVKKLKDSDKTS